MILAMNIGNTNFAFGFKEEGEPKVFRYPIQSIGSQTDFEQVILRSMGQEHIKREEIDGAIVSSVNPKLTPYLYDATQCLFGLSPLVVDDTINMKLNLSNYDAKRIGADRIAVCEGAVSQCVTPMIVFDFGTATTINVMDGAQQFLGGSILTGITMGLAALSTGTAQLPKNDSSEWLDQPQLIGQDTRACLISGALFGNAAMLDGMVQRIEAALHQQVTVFLTGGNARYISEICQTKVIYEPDLLMRGLFVLYKNNKGIR